MRHPLSILAFLLLGACKPDDTIDTDPGDTVDTGPEVVDEDGDGYSTDDCDDTNADIHPGADEHCDGVDEDCDGEIDEDAVDAPTWYPDADQDGWGDTEQPLIACEAPSSTVELPGDCDDERDDVYPGATEVCLDGVDNDCDETTWPECSLEGEVTTSIAPHRWNYQPYTACWFVDLDDDGGVDGLCQANGGTLTVLEGPIVEAYPRGELVEGDGTYGAHALGDFDGDGTLDVAFDTGAIALGPLVGGAEATYLVELDSPADTVISGDFNADGQSDLVFVDLYSGASVLLGPFLGGTTLDDAVLTIQAETHLYYPWAADLMGSGADTLVFNIEDGLAFFDGARRGTVTESEADLAIEGAAAKMAPPDLDGDGTADLVLFRRIDGRSEIAIFGGSWADLEEAEPTATIDASGTSGFELADWGDIDNDGHDDLLFYNQANEYYVFAAPFVGMYALDDALLTVVHDLEGELEFAGQGRLADLDHDEITDLFVQEKSMEDSSFGYVFWGTAW